MTPRGVLKFILCNIIYSVEYKSSMEYSMEVQENLMSITVSSFSSKSNAYKSISISDSMSNGYCLLLYICYFMATYCNYVGAALPTEMVRPILGFGWVQIRHSNKISIEAIGLYTYICFGNDDVIHGSHKKRVTHRFIPLQSVSFYQYHN